MKRIFLIGAGRSSGALVDYIRSYCTEKDWYLTVGDQSLELAKAKTKDHPRLRAIQIELANHEQLKSEIEKADIVISLMPAHMHLPVAVQCVESGKSLLTASYVNPEIADLGKLAEKKGVSIVMEAGLDPGIDHMSAKKEIDELQRKGLEIISFKSFTGGLIAPESDNNPWNYKFTWNPRNVVLAGQGTVKFIRNGKFKYIPYFNVFRRTEKVQVDGYGDFEAYPNRDALKYIEIYNLNNIPTLFRGTLRKAGFCEAWNVFVQLGMTDDTYYIDNVSELTWRDFINSYLVFSKRKTVEEKVARFFNIGMDSETMQKLTWLGIFTTQKIGLSKATPAQVLQHLLEQKWVLMPEDKDMVVMQHQFKYIEKGVTKKKITSLVVKGDDASNTSMSKTVGLPLGIITKHYLDDTIQLKPGVVLPTTPEIYDPVLDELKNFGITFFEKKIIE